MINATNPGKSILDKMLYTQDSNDNSISFSKTPYLALFTKMPEVRTGGAAGDETDGAYSFTAGVEVQENTSAENKTYCRILLSSKGVTQKRLLSSAVIVGDSSISEKEREKDKAAKFPIGSARVANQDLIIFPEAEKEAYGQIVGFGIYTSLTGGTPIYWGKLSEDAGENGVVTVNQNEIPIFRLGDFRLCLG